MAEIISLGIDATCTHPEYDRMAESWEKCRDGYLGAPRIKSKREKYLPRPFQPTVDSGNVLPDLDRKYNNYLLRAQYLNVLAPTLEIMQGSIFRREAQISIPEEIQYIVKDATGTKISLTNFVKAVVLDVGITGRFGILIDQLPVPSGISKAREEELGIKPRFTGYAAEDILMWHEGVVNGIRQPTLIVLNEAREEFDEINPFKMTEKHYQRVLKLDSEGYYYQELWDKDEQIYDEEMVTYPTKTGGERFDYIPFVFCGISNNTCKVDQPPLLGMAELALGHYRNSADLEESCHITGQSTLIMTGLSQSWVDQNFKSGLLLGANAAVPLPINGDAKLIQASPNSLVAEEMKRKEERMVRLGLRAMDGAGGRETAQAARIRFSAEQAVMTRLANSVSDALQIALEILYDYMTGEKTDDIVYKLNTQFYQNNIDPQVVTSLIDSYAKQIITFDELRDNLAEMGLIVDEESEIEEPSLDSGEDVVENETETENTPVSESEDQLAQNED